MSIKGRLYSTYQLGIAMENNVRKDAAKSISHLALLKTLLSRLLSPVTSSWLLRTASRILNACGYRWLCQKRCKPWSEEVALWTGCTASAGPLWCSIAILVILASPYVESNQHLTASAETSDTRQRIPIVQQWNLGLEGLPSTGL